MTATANAELPPNPIATKALIAGVASVIPGVGIVAIILGMLAGQRARALGGSGRGRAFLAMLLGIGSLMLWAMLVGAYFQGKAMMRAAPAVAATKQFVMLVGSGNVSAAKGLCTDAIDIDRLTNTAVEFSELGGFTGDIVPAGGQPAGQNISVSYRLPFEKGERQINTEWTFVDNQPRLVNYSMESPPATQPSK